MAAVTVSRIGESSEGSELAAFVALDRCPCEAWRPAVAGSGPRIAFRSTFCIPTVQARKFGSDASRTTRPSPNGSSTTAAVPPSSSAPRANPETKKSP